MRSRQRRWIAALFLERSAEPPLVALALAALVVACGDTQATSACAPIPSSVNPASAAVIRCPDLTSVRAAPDQAQVGTPVVVVATAVGVIDAGTALFSWSASSGSFGDPAAPITTFTCAAPGRVTLTVAATQDGCSEAMSTTLDCVAAADGG
jgi:hypothetical protein